MTPQEKMKAKLEGLGLPFREVKCYGSQITVEAWCLESAKRWAAVLGKFSTVRGVVESTPYTKATEDLPNRREVVKVWRVYAAV